MHRFLSILPLFALGLMACSDVSITTRPEREGDDPGECEDGADNDGNGLFDCDDPMCLEAPVCQPNQPPSIPEVSIEPFDPRTNDSLSCVFDFVSQDPEGGEITYEWAWKLDGEDAGIDEPFVDSSLTTKDQTWTCEVVPSDGQLFGPTGSASATVSNTPPTAPEIDITPGTPEVNNILSCAVTVPSEDADGDEVTYAVRWFQNGNDGAFSNEDVPAEATAPGDEWACQITPFDGTDEGPRAEAVVQVHVDVNPQIAAGARHNCKIDTQGAYTCWGGDDSGQLSGQPPFSLSHISSGEAHSCGLNIGDGTVSCWGDSSAGQGIGTPGTFIDVSVSTDANCAVTTTGELDCWGSADFWSDLPPSGPWRTVATTDDWACARSFGGNIDCWNGAPPPPSTTGFAKLSPGTGHVCGLKDNGGIECWGDDSHGQVSGAPADLGYTEIASGDHHACALDGNGFAHCWGDDSAGQSTVAGGQFIILGAGWHHTCGMRDNGLVACWGCDGHDSGQCATP